MTEAVQVALIVGISGAATSAIGSGAMIWITIIKGRAQQRYHKIHEDVSTANHNLSVSTNNAVNRLEIAVNGDLDERIKAMIRAELNSQSLS